MITPTVRRQLQALFNRLNSLCYHRFLNYPCNLIYNALNLPHEFLRRRWPQSMNCLGILQNQSYVILNSDIQLDFWRPYVTEDCAIFTPATDWIYMNYCRIHTSYDTVYRIKYMGNAAELLQIFHQLGFDVAVIFALTIEAYYADSMKTIDINQANGLMQDIQELVNDL